MKFENTNVSGFENAILGMRLPMCKDITEARAKSDSQFDKGFVYIGEDDLKLAKKLISADAAGRSQPNSKFLRMIHVQVCITAPLFFFKEMDTYKVGTTANSTSTMHTITKTPITRDCFENGNLLLPKLITFLEGYRQNFLATKEKIWWDKLIVNLPESWLQTRMFDCDYTTLRIIYKWRKNHKLTQWHDFCNWIESLPYSKEFICE